MKINRILIRNILGIRELDIAPGEVTEIRGPNGSGKTSVFGAIRAALGISDNTVSQLIHNGAKEAECVIVFDDDSQLRRTFTEDDKTVSLFDGKGRKIARPATAIDAIYKATQFNPLRLLQTDAESRKKRLQTVLECIPMQAERTRVQSMAPQLDLALVDFSRHGMEVIDDVYKEAFEQRTDVNRDLKNTNSTLADLVATMPSGIATNEDLDKRMADLIEAREELQKKRRNYDDKFETTRREERDRALSQHNREKAEAEADYQQAVSQAQERRNERITHSLTEYERTCEHADIAFHKATTEKHAAFVTIHDPLVRQIAEVNTLLQSRAVYEDRKKIITEREKQRDALAAESNALTETLERLKAYRDELAATLPIPGLEVKDAAVYFNSLSFDQLNTAQKIKLAVDLATLQAGELRVICVDGCEALDAESLAELERQVTSRDLQLITTHVSNEPFTVATHAGPAMETA